VTGSFSVIKGGIQKGSIVDGKAAGAVVDDLAWQRLQCAGDRSLTGRVGRAAAFRFDGRQQSTHCGPSADKLWLIASKHEWPFTG
jgi:hypothetical protein